MWSLMIICLSLSCPLHLSLWGTVTKQSVQCTNDSPAGGCVSRQVGQGEISIHQDEDEVMNQLVVGAFFLHPDEGLSICKEWIQVRDRCKISDKSDKFLLNHSNLLRVCFFSLDTVHIRFLCAWTEWTNCMCSMTRQGSSSWPLKHRKQYAVASRSASDLISSTTGIRILKLVFVFSSAFSGWFPLK